MDAAGESMNNLYNQLQHLRDQYNIAWDILEQDYLLSWMLAGIADTSLKEHLIFKGGTALRKCYFGNYRFSQDLDFTIAGTPLPDKELEKLMNSACKQAMVLRSLYGDRVQIVCQKYKQKRPHPFEQKAFVIMAQFPWQRDFCTRIMVDITTQESLLLAPEKLAIIHNDYDEVISDDLYVYRLEEIMAEKIRAIVQYSIKFHERGWGRSRARDYYDLWRIYHQYSEKINANMLPELVIKKCSAKQVSFNGPDELFTSNLIEDLEEAWIKWLDPFVPDLPSHKTVLRELRTFLSETWPRDMALSTSKKINQIEL